MDSLKGLCVKVLLLVALASCIPHLATADEFDDILPHLIMVESSGNERAYNTGSGAVGLCQITKYGALAEWNMNNDEKYTLNDMYNPELNKKVALWYLRWLKSRYLKNQLLSPVKEALGSKLDIQDNNMPKRIMFYIDDAEDYDMALVLSAYNGGITRFRKKNYCVGSMPKETQNYVYKILKRYKEDV